MMSSRPKDPKTARNKNVLVVGGSGSGQDEVLSLSQSSCNYTVHTLSPTRRAVIAGGVRKAHGSRNGYKVKIFNSINFKKSHALQPLCVYPQREGYSEAGQRPSLPTPRADGKSEATTSGRRPRRCSTRRSSAISTTKPPKEEQNFATLIEFINAMEVREDDETFENNVDLAFQELAQREPNHFAVRQYKKYKLAAGKTAKSINISCRRAPCSLRYSGAAGDHHVRRAGAGYPGRNRKRRCPKTVLFLIMSDTDSTFNFLISMIYSQLIQSAVRKGRRRVRRAGCPIHVRCLIDECANIGQIPNLEKLMATIRSREISACLVLQAQSPS